jgi:hypothetical protein
MKRLMAGLEHVDLLLASDSSVAGYFNGRSGLRCHVHCTFPLLTALFSHNWATHPSHSPIEHSPNPQSRYKSVRMTSQPH